MRLENPDQMATHTACFNTEQTYSRAPNCNKCTYGGSVISKSINKSAREYRVLSLHTSVPDIHHPRIPANFKEQTEEMYKNVEKIIRMKKRRTKDDSMNKSECIERTRNVLDMTGTTK